jgi:hypothetical protein
MSHLCGARKSLFSSLEIRKRYIDGILYHLTQLLSLPQIPDEAIAELVSGLRRFINNFSSKEVFSQPNFPAFLEKFSVHSMAMVAKK